MTNNIHLHNGQPHEDEHEALVTAYALGQLAGEEQLAVEAQVARSPQLQQQVDAIRSVTGQLVRGLQSEPLPAPSKKLAEKVADQLDFAASMQVSLPPKKRTRWLEAMIGVAICGGVAFMLWPEQLAVQQAARVTPAASTLETMAAKDKRHSMRTRSDDFTLGEQLANKNPTGEVAEADFDRTSDASAGQGQPASGKYVDQLFDGEAASERPAVRGYQAANEAELPRRREQLVGQVTKRGEAKPNLAIKNPGPSSVSGTKSEDAAPASAVTTNAPRPLAEPSARPVPAATPTPATANPVAGRYAIIPGEPVHPYGDVSGGGKKGAGQSSYQRDVQWAETEKLRKETVVLEQIVQEQRARGLSAEVTKSLDDQLATSRSKLALAEVEFGRFDERPAPDPTTAEQYDAIVENTFLPAKSVPLSTFSIDVDTASYANTRRFLTSGQRPPRDAVRIEELINYFSYDDPQPQGNAPFSANMEIAECPWTPGHHLLRIGLKGKEMDKNERPNSNLVFLLDVSGSMSAENKLPLVKQSMQMLVRELRENDSVTIVTYAGNEGLALDSTSGDQKEKINQAIETLGAGGSTHASAGITLAYEKAQQHFIKGGANRVILCTDGDFNVGVTNDEALVDLITSKAKSGVFLSVLGFGMGNLKDSKMEKLADKGNGNYAYIDTLREGRKVLVEEMSSSLVTIAKDVKIQIEFNPAVVSSYRQIGYENRVLAAKDFNDDTKDAGEIGAGHSVTALYEVVLVGSEQPTTPAVEGEIPLKYQKPATTPAAATEQPTKALALTEEAASGELLTLKLRFKTPDGDKSELVEFPFKEQPKKFGAASENLRFASAVASFGMLLRGSNYRGGATMSAVEEIAAASLGKDPNGYRTEFLDLVRKAGQITGN